MLAVILAAGPLYLLGALAIVCVVFVASIGALCLDCGKRRHYVRVGGADDEIKDQETRQRLAQQQQRDDFWLQAQYFIRNLANVALVPNDVAMWEMGTRNDKARFLVEERTGEKRKHLLTITKFHALTPLQIRSRQGREAFNEVLDKLKHPFIQMIHRCDVLCDETMVVVSYRFSPEGSLRDRLFGVKPIAPASNKYRQTIAGVPLKEHFVALYGRQVLEALLYLERSGVPYGHLHAGNVILYSGSARLSDVENGLLLLERSQERLLRQFAKAQPEQFRMTNINVLGFGALLFEMITASQLATLTDLEHLRTSSSSAAMEIVKDIFCADRSARITSLSELSQNQLFANVKLTAVDLAQQATFTPATAARLKVAVDAVALLHGDSVSAPLSLSRSGTLKKSSVKRSAVGTSPQAMSPMRDAPTPANTPSSPSLATSSPKKSNKKSSARSSARASGTLATSPPPPPPAVQSAVSPPPRAGRNALLGSIASFKATKLKKTRTNDRSAPRV